MMLQEHQREHGNTMRREMNSVHESLDDAADAGVTVSQRAPGARHPECGASSRNGGLIKLATNSRGGSRPGSGRKPGSVVISSTLSGLRWYCIETHARCEVVVADALMDMGFDALAPQFMDLLPANPVRKLPEREVLRPAFPGFVLAEFDQTAPEWRRIATQQGVRRIMGSAPERPTPVPHPQVAWIIGQFGFRGAQRRTRLELPPAEPIAVGVVVRVAAGPMEGKSGPVLKSNGRRVKVAIDGWPVEMAQAAVEVVGAARGPGGI